MIAQAGTPCFKSVDEWTRHGKAPQDFNYTSWEELYQDYFVFTVARNPYSRAASAYDFLYGLKEVRDAQLHVRSHEHNRTPSFVCACNGPPWQTATFDARVALFVHLMR